MIPLLLRLGLGELPAKLVTYVLLPALVLVGIYFGLKVYGQRAYDRGVVATDAKWKAASDKVLTAAAQGTSTADKKELPRVVDFTAKVEQEKAKLDAAQKDGSSPLDVLFPPATNGM